MKTKEKKIKAWLDFIQADLDALALDELILVIYPIYKDIVSYLILSHKVHRLFPEESSRGRKVVSLPKELRRALKAMDDLGWDQWDKLTVALRSLSEWNWGKFQQVAKKFMKNIIMGPNPFIMIRTDEYLVEVPPGIFRKGIICEGEFEKEIIAILIDLFDGIHKSAFKLCPECNKWFFHTSKKEKEYCTNRCASRHLTRKKRTKSEEAKEEYNKKMREYMKKRHQKNNPKPDSKEIVECPGNPDDPQDVEITPTECINPNGKNIRGIWKNTCPTCPYFKKGDTK